MKRFLHLMGMLCLGFSLVVNSGCFVDNVICQEAEGDFVTDTLDLDSIHSLDLSMDANVFIKKGNTQSVVIRGKEDAVKRVNKDIIDGEWRIEFDGNDCFRNHDIDIEITVAAIETINVSGSGDVISSDVFDQNDDMDLIVSGSGLIKMGVDIEEVNSKISGSGDINLWGNVQKNILKISGSGKLSAFDLIAVEHDLTISGSGNAEIFVDGGDLNGNISGSGKIYYRGTPGSLNINVTGSGKIIDDN